MARKRFCESGLVLAGFALLASGFLLGGDCDGGDPPGEGVLLVILTSASVDGTPLEGLSALSVTSSRTEVVHRRDCGDPGTERRIIVSSIPSSIDLTTAAPDVPEIVARLSVPVGCVMQLRLIVDEMSATIDGTTVPVRVPSGPQTGIKIVPVEGEPPFPIDEGRTTAIRVDYDPAHSLVVNRGQGVLEKPVLEAYSVDPDLALGFVLDEVVVTFAPETTQDTIDAVVAGIGGTIIGQYPHHYVTVRLPNTDMMRHAIEYFDGQESVRVVLPESLVAVTQPNPFPAPDEPSDPYWIDREPSGFENLNLRRIHALDAWRTTTGSTDVVVAVVDTAGFELLHEELLAAWWIKEAEIPPATRATLVDVDDDGHITFDDLNADANRDACPRAASPPVDLCDPRDLINGRREVYGWQDRVDNDGDGFTDDLIGWDFVDNDNLPQPVTEGMTYHGTGIAGVIAAAGNNGRSAVGIAWHARVVPVKVPVLVASGGDYAYRSTVTRGFAYALANQARVINASFAGLYVKAGSASDQEISAGWAGFARPTADKWSAVVDRLRREWRDVVPGAISGNALYAVGVPNMAYNLDAEGEVFFWPGVFGVSRPDLGLDSPVEPTMIAVGNAELWSDFTGTERVEPTPCREFCGRGVRTVQIAAPGRGWRLLSVGPTDPAGLVASTTDCGDAGYPRCSGSSFAAPLVAGTAALLFAHTPTLTAQEVKNRILAAGEAVPHAGLDGAVEHSRFLDVAGALAVGP